MAAAGQPYTRTEIGGLTIGLLGGTIRQLTDDIPVQSEDVVIQVRVTIYDENGNTLETVAFPKGSVVSVNLYEAARRESMNIDTKLATLARALEELQRT